MNKKWELDKNRVIFIDIFGCKFSYPINFVLLDVKNFKSIFNLSSEEIDDLVTELSKEKQLEFNFAPGFNWEEEKPKICKHEWMEYLGFNIDKFEYCKLCGEKKL